MTQSKGMQTCKELNAGLPIPKNEAENAFFTLLSKQAYNTEATKWKNLFLGLHDPTKSGIRENWIDVDGNKIGDGYVNERVNYQILFSFLSHSLENASEFNILLNCEPHRSGPPVTQCAHPA